MHFTKHTKTNVFNLFFLIFLFSHTYFFFNTKNHLLVTKPPCLARRQAVREQSTSQYYFVLQSLRKVLPSTTLYYKACAK